MKWSWYEFICPIVIFGSYYNSILFQLEMIDKQEQVSDFIFSKAQTDPQNLSVF